MAAVPKCTGVRTAYLRHQLDAIDPMILEALVGTCDVEQLANQIEAKLEKNKALQSRHPLKTDGLLSLKRV